MSSRFRRLFLLQFVKADGGQSLIEYALLAGAIVLGCIAAAPPLSASTMRVYQRVESALTAAVQGDSPGQDAGGGNSTNSDTTNSGSSSGSSNGGSSNNNAGGHGGGNSGNSNAGGNGNSNAGTNNAGGGGNGNGNSGGNGRANR